MSMQGQIIVSRVSISAKTGERGSVATTTGAITNITGIDRLHGEWAKSTNLPLR